MTKRPDNKSLLLTAGLFIAAMGMAVFVYWPGLGGPLLLDDLPQLLGLIAQSGEGAGFLFGNYLISDTGPLGRPVSMFTFITDAIFYGSDTWWWKYHSLMFHLASGAILFWLAGLLAGRSRQVDQMSAWNFALVVATVWMLHPLLVSTVLYTVQRMTILSTFFVLAGMTAYVKGRILHEHGRGIGWIPVAAAFLIFLPLAAASKETGALLAIYCCLLELCIFSFAGPPLVRRTLYWLHGTVVAMALIAAVLLLSDSVYLEHMYAARDFTLYQRVLTQFRALAFYLELILVPLPMLMGFFHDDFVLSRGLFQPISTVLCLGMVVAAIVLSFALRKRYPLAAFGVLFFFASHALESTVFALELVFEHRNYVGSAGIILAVVAVASRFRERRLELAGGAIVIVAILGFLTLQRAQIWSTPQTMYQHMYAVHPESPRLNALFVETHAAAGEFDDARLILGRMPPSLGRGLIEVRMDCMERGMVTEQTLSATAGIDAPVLTPYVTIMIREIIDAAASGECRLPNATMMALIDKLQGAPAHSKRDHRAIDFAKARLLELQGNTEGAVQVYLTRQEQTRGDAVATYLAADMLARRGHFARARHHLKDAAEIERRARVVRHDFASTIYRGIAEAYVNDGLPEEALATYREANHHMPGVAKNHLATAELLASMGRYEEATRELSVAQSIGMADCLECGYRRARLAAAIEQQAAGLQER